MADNRLIGKIARKFGVSVQDATRLVVAGLNTPNKIRDAKDNLPASVSEEARVKISKRKKVK